jgi:hypothetical protein
METELVGEERQGEAVMLEQNTELLTGKKLYLECSLCRYAIDLQSYIQLFNLLPLTFPSLASLFVNLIPNPQ